MKILFVDDEQMILDGIERSLFDTDWEVLCALGGEEGLSFLDEEPFDVVISDMRMPGMDGADFLKKVYERHPEAVRIVLSGHADDEASVRASLVAHQWLDKPCSQEDLVAALTRIQHAIERLPSIEVRQAVGKVTSLPTPSSTFLQIKELINSDSDAISSVTNLVAQDPGLAAKVLQLTNSSFFYRGNKITDVKDAVVRLGLDVVVGVVLLAEMYMKSPEKKHFNTSKEQKHSLAVSSLVGEMLEGEEKKVAIMAGLLHDIGRYIMAQVFPDKISAYKEALNDKSKHIYDIEHGIFGTDHGQLAGYLLFLWGFSNDVIEAVVNHHNIERHLGEKWCPSAAIFFANHMLKGRKIPPELIERYSVQDRMERWYAIAEEMINDKSA